MPIDSVDDPISTGQAHETILQLLNRQIGDTFFSAESFDNAEAWNGIPVVFASEHPDMAAFEKDPAAELERISKKTGKRADIIGRISDARIETTGHPRLMGNLDISEDPEVFQLIEAGTLSPSTGFWCNVDGGTLKGNATPNHVLVFEEDHVNQPRDRGAVILNQSKNVAFTSAGKVMSGANQSKFQALIESLKSLFDDMTGGGSTTEDEPQSPEEETKKPVANMEPAEPEEEPITNMTDEIIALKDAEIAELKNKLGEIEQASKDAAWVALKNKLPPGLVHKPEDEAATRELFEKDPFAFTNKILDLKREEKKESGEEFTNKDTPPANEYELMNTKARVPGTLH